MASIVKMFPNQPALEVLLSKMYSYLKDQPVSEALKNRTTIAGWIKSQQWKDIFAALSDAGLTAEYQSCMTGATTPEAKSKCLTSFLDKLTNWAVVKYTSQAADNPEDYASAGAGGDLVNEGKRDAGMSTGAKVAIGLGVAAAVGGAGYYVYTKRKRNPEIRTGHYGYGSKPTKGLRSTLDSPAVEKAVIKLAKKNFRKAEQIDCVYEHGQWWVNVFPDPEDPSGDQQASYSVVDTSSGLGLERL